MTHRFEGLNSDIFLNTRQTTNVNIDAFLQDLGLFRGGTN